MRTGRLCLAAGLVFWSSNSTAADLKSLDKKLAELPRQLLRGRSPAAGLRVAVAPFVPPGKKVRTPFGLHAAQEVETGLKNEAGLRLMEQSQLDAVLERKKLELSGLYKASTLTELGSFEGVDALVLGTYEVGSKEAKVVARWVDLQSGEQAASARVYFSKALLPPEFLKEAELPAESLEEERQRLSRRLTELEQETRAKKENERLLQRISALQKVTGNPQSSEMDLSRVNDALGAGENWLAAYNYQYGLGGNPVDFDKAIQHYRNALDLTPQDGELHYRLGVAYASAGRNAEAQTELQEALAADPSRPEVHHALGRALLADAKTAQALTEFEAALTQAPAEAQFRLGRAEALLAAHRKQEAIPELLEILRLEPDEPCAHASLGQIYKEQGDMKLATRHFTQAIRRYRAELNSRPDDADTFWLLAKTYEGRGDGELAAETYQKYLDAEKRPGQTQRILQAKDAVRRLPAQNP